MTAPRRPLIRLDGTSGITQWWLPNAEGHRQLLRAAGFALERESRPLLDPFRTSARAALAAPDMAAPRGSPAALLTGGDGVPHLAVLARAG